MRFMIKFPIARISPIDSNSDCMTYDTKTLKKIYNGEINPFMN